MGKNTQNEPKISKNILKWFILTEIAKKPKIWWFLSEFEHFQPFLTDFSFSPFILLKLRGGNEKSVKMVKNAQIHSNSPNFGFFDYLGEYGPFGDAFGDLWLFLSKFEHFQQFLTDFSFSSFNLLKLKGENEKSVKNC